jgi:uncharacterized protein YktA (UPF0223 family)
MPMHELDITIDPQGRVKVHVKGAKGKKCLEYVELFKEILQGEVKEKQLTSEYYEQPVEVVEQERARAKVKRS